MAEDLSWYRLESQCYDGLLHLPHGLDLHVGVLVRGHLGRVGQVDVLSLHEGTVDLLLVDVLDHRLK